MHLRTPRTNPVLPKPDHSSAVRTNAYRTAPYHTAGFSMDDHDALLPTWFMSWPFRPKDGQLTVGYAMLNGAMVGILLAVAYVLLTIALIDSALEL